MTSPPMNSPPMTSPPAFRRTKAVHCNLYMLDEHHKEELQANDVEHPVDVNRRVWFFIGHPWYILNLFYPQKVARMRSSMSECADAVEAKFHDLIHLLPALHNVLNGVVK
uniref:Uncharacterized protein n=1 Tax=Panagrolaimus sp. ES5 TaxID=591445 RepID=A0AC34GPS4_9BILA